MTLLSIGDSLQLILKCQISFYFTWNADRLHLVYSNYILREFVNFQWKIGVSESKEGGWKMLKVRFFLNEPNGKPWKHFKKMMPGLGDTYDIQIETMSKPKAEYMTDEYFELDLPVAPAVMVADDILVEGTDISEKELEAAIRRHLDLL